MAKSLATNAVVYLRLLILLEYSTVGHYWRGGFVVTAQVAACPYSFKKYISVITVFVRIDSLWY
jgi:hypothetical protein